MYSANSPRRQHPGFVPQSDGRRLVFPLSQYNGTFKTENFIPSLVDSRCSIDDINYFLNDVYFTTKRMKPVRTTNRLIIWSFVLYLFFFIFGIMIEMENADYYDADSEYQDIDDTGIIMIFGGIFILLVVNIVAAVYRSAARSALYKQLVGVLERHKSFFLQRGLRWAVPENCNWLELWMDFRYFSPYYMQPYVPAIQPLQRANSQGFPTQQPQAQIQQNNASHNQTLPVNTTEALDNQSINEPDANISRIQVPNSTTAIPIQQGYPTFPQYPQFQQAPQQLQYPQFQQFPQFPQQGAYPFYQPPQITDNLLGYQVPENDNSRLFRPY